jgi:hypothetical protein
MKRSVEGLRLELSARKAPSRFDAMLVRAICYLVGFEKCIIKASKSMDFMVYISQVASAAFARREGSYDGISRANMAAVVAVRSCIDLALVSLGLRRAQEAPRNRVRSQSGPSQVDFAAVALFGSSLCCG